MFCPECAAEYREGFTECADCRATLVVKRPERFQYPNDKFVSVFETTDVALLPVIKSVLQSAEIPFFVRGDEAMGILPVGSFGSGINYNGRGLGAAVVVHESWAEEAKALLCSLNESASS